MTKEENEDLVLVRLDRYISIEGALVDRFGKRHDYDIDPVYRKNRLTRDGPNHHITLVNHLEIRQLIDDRYKNEGLSTSQKKKLFGREVRNVHQQIVQRFGEGAGWDRPVDIGMGKCKDNDAVSYYRIIYWPFGQAIRDHLGLPRTNFHITVGFSPKDVHLYKGPGSLLCLQDNHRCRSSTMRMLISFTDYYVDDSMFIQALIDTCRRHSLQEELQRLVDFSAQNKKELRIN